jgi:hypothetical protein
MTADKFGGWLFIIIGLILAVIADPIGRHHASLFKTNARFHQKFTFYGGLFSVLLGFLILIGIL